MKKNNKKIVLRKWLNNLLTIITLIIIVLVLSTIESIGNCYYDKWLLIHSIVIVINTIILCKYGRPFEE